MAIFTENRLLEFNEFLLLEAFGLRISKFGLNETMDDSRIQHTTKYGGVVLYTFMQHDEMYYIIAIRDDGSVSFGTSMTHSLNPMDYSDRRSPTGSIIRVLNQVFFVFSKLIDRYRGDTLHFKAADLRLGVMYQHLMKNPSFLDILLTAGWEYDGEIDGRFTFSRISR